MKNKLALAIDGPASSGKSTVAKLIADEKNFIYIDTGAMYRALTYHALDQGVDIHDGLSLLDLLDQSKISFAKKNGDQLTYLNGQDVSLAIRQNDVTQAVSQVSSHKEVRQEMVRRQQELASQGSVVMDGRDIGTVVLPDAEVKIFLEASPEERARRRYQENQSKGISSTYQDLLEEIKKRDQLDSTREVSPLKQAQDAVVIDTTSLTIEEVKDKILQQF
ncbi:Cytidylate kinase [Alloiococcus otitis]|uniref:Cytidylate kinase n=1 Tax=Alloiococcus otitis ATCC 51267 TaxID=883081 RepID=K9ETC0_9LACT|nr:(d)CMP kinase [Alloiococcus otitis]EKU94242.1 cytidylate kinase [Alloiococcus otitis ATCC 51267]SUU81124.1 Cytidylate kinase [Alloiococcus otitis]